MFDIDLAYWPNRGGELEIIAAIEAPPVIRKILSRIRAYPRARHRAHQPGAWN
jgi:hypothetical protein